MINTTNYVLLERNGYTNKIEADENIRLWYGHLIGVTTYYENGKWYIVQSKSLAIL